MAHKIDAQVENHGSVWLIRLLSRSARKWVTDNVADDAMYFGNALAVEPRYVRDIANAMLADGLTVR